MTIQELSEKAVDFIVETQVENDYICERMNGEWCEEHCIDHLKKECVLYYLENVYHKEERI